MKMKLIEGLGAGRRIMSEKFPLVSPYLTWKRSELTLSCGTPTKYLVKALDDLKLVTALNLGSI
jgi:hypothetical protein